MKNETKQTVVEWLVEQIIKEKGLVDLDIQAAKEMEKEQIMDAWIDDRFPLDKDWVKQCAEQYYNETFNTKEK